MIKLKSIIITRCSHICYGPLCDVSHETYDRENDESSEHTGEGIDAADDDRISGKQKKAWDCLVIYPTFSEIKPLYWNEEPIAQKVL